MSVIGLNPERDKKARLIIYGGFSGYCALLGFLADLNMGQGNMLNRQKNIIKIRLGKFIHKLAI